MSNPKPIKISLSPKEALRRAMQVPPPADELKPPERSKTKPAANTAKPPRPVKKKDSADIDRADSEGMAQVQHKAKRKNAVKPKRKPGRA